MNRGSWNVKRRPSNVNMGPCNAIRGLWNLNSGRWNVIIEPRNVIMGPRNVNRGTWNANRDRGMRLRDRVM